MATVYENSVEDLRSQLRGDPLVIAELVAGLLKGFMEERLILDGRRSTEAAARFGKAVTKLDRAEAKLGRVADKLANLSKLRGLDRKLTAISARLDKLEQTQAEANAVLAQFMEWAQANFEQMATASAQNQSLGLLLELAEQNGGRHAR